MITLTKKLKSSKGGGGGMPEPPKKRISVRDKLLVKEVRLHTLFFYIYNYT